MDQRSKTTSQKKKNGIRIQCNTENFVPIVVPGLSTSSSSSLPSSTSMTPSRQEIDHPTSSSSSSTSPTMTSSSVSSESVARQERGDPCSSEISEEQLLTEPTKNPKPSENEDRDLERGAEFLNTETLTQVLLMSYLWSLRLREVRIWVNTVFILTSRKTEIARSVKGPTLQGFRAEDVLAESYFVQKSLVI